MSLFCDEVRITVTSGKGGNGLVSMRREKYIPRGGPNGGDGGKGGNVIIRVNSNLNTLSQFRHKKNYKAENGESGMSKDMHGKDGEDLILEVPPGALIYDHANGELLADLEAEGEEIKVAEGGIGGFGNAHFTSSTRQAPDFAEMGDMGEKKELKIELKLVADVGIIGMPSAGKSTLIASISNVRPKIAAYHFTTLVPNLGVCDYHDQSFVVVDVPGLIEGASEGKGLGHTFLKHIERTRILVHLVDVLELDKALDAYKIINTELAKYSDTLKKKTQVVALNKCDALDEESIALVVEQFENYDSKLKGQVFPISAVAHKGLEKLLDRVIYELSQVKKEYIQDPEDTIKVYRPHLEDPKKWFIRLTDEGPRVSGQRIEQIVRMSPLKNPSAMLRIIDVLERLGISKSLEKNYQLKEGEVFYVGDVALKFKRFEEVGEESMN